MRPSLPFLTLLAFLAALPLLTACGSEVESAQPDPRMGIQDEPAGPWGDVDPDSLFGATAVENIRLTQVEIDVLDLPRGWDGMRIAAISDLQLGLWEQNAEVAAAAVQRALQARPDLVVLLGDYLAVGRDTEALTRVLAPLRGRPVMAVLGDRDVRNDSVEARVRQALSDAGIRLLVNDAAPFARNGDTAWIAGINPEFATRSVGDQEYILATTGGPRTPVVLTHNPLLAARAPEGRRPVILAGHAFCGRVELPGTPRLGWYETTGFPGAVIPGAPRLYRIRGNTLFVTCGTGYSFLPVRLGAPPEVALVTLRAVGLMEQQPEADAEAARLDTIMQQYEVQN